ncbi:MAG: 7-carboxy-7-deazaguanine synthase QueE [Chitinophagaceae bacterium]|nr:7-carboxy-7-deazaguanine synthase QueE [Chitinophagaceae bacterium]MCW5905726.1 7-carboxy-7-deazaguanine synthase QueE [Chitinophagaceae bacterium]
MESFYTLQGEGFYSGKAAYFIRLAGCNVGCVWCDVKESWDESLYPSFSVEQIVAKAIKEVHSPRSIAHSKRETLNFKPIIVITGGEPLLYNLDNLTTKLIQAGFETNIETSGSSPLSGQWNWICLSPKKFKLPLPEVVKKANELKVIVFNKHDFTWAETYAAQVNPDCKLYLQPEWDKKEIVTPLIVDYIKANPQWQLSLQTHKYINVP